ncbi:CPBP family intramembrane metalloprotease [Inquilinus sp. KBS0705]|nr:CPBP family intramembrane metalloprotease [Inquilinus sp. KBS0705]
MLKEIFEVSHYPALDNNQAFIKKLLLLLQVYGILFAVMILSAPLSSMGDYVVTHVLHYKSINQQYKTSMDGFFRKYGYLKAALYICLLGPLLEETVFRLVLSLKRQHIAIAVATALFLFVSLVPGFKALNIWISTGVRLLLLIAGYLVLINSLPKQVLINNTLHTRIIITSILLFGLVHITNFVPLQWPIIFMYPLFVIPQLLMGWALTYTRFKSGFFWGVALHVIINSVSTLLHLSIK